MTKTAVVAGAGGFIGHHMVGLLKTEGLRVRGVDVKMPEAIGSSVPGTLEYEETGADEFEVLDLREWESCLKATRGADYVYQLAVDMGALAL